MVSHQFARSSKHMAMYLDTHAPVSRLLPAYACVYTNCRRAHAETVAASVGYSHERNERRRDVIVELREQPTHQWPPYPRQLLDALEQTKKSAELVSLREL